MNVIKEKRFAGFIITYNRPNILAKTIEIVLNQSLAPEKILIVDNSDNEETRKKIQELNDQRISYYSVGYNAGPAGAAKIGFEILIEEGFKWIYWGDDDDPPLFENEFEHLLEMAAKIEGIGAIGSVGSKFDVRTGLKIRFKDEECIGPLESDSIGGGHNMIVNAKAVKATKVYPDPRLFFGFEELIFLRSLKLKGYKIITSGESLLKHREFHNRTNIKNTQKLIPTKKFTDLKRDYYSYRNLIYSFYYTWNLKSLAFKHTFRALIKIPFSYIKGLKYGFATTKFMITAILHAFTKKMGKQY